MLRAMDDYLRTLDAMDEFFSPAYMVVDLVASNFLKTHAAMSAVEGTCQWRKSST